MYKLIKENFGMVIEGNQLDIYDVIDTDNDRIKGDKLKDIVIGSCVEIKSESGDNWITTPIIQIIENKKELKKFKTENSFY